MDEKRVEERNGEFLWTSTSMREGPTLKGWGETLENALGDTDASSRLGIKLTWRSLPKVFSGGNCGVLTALSEGR